MKKLLVLCFALFLLSVPAVVFASSCDSDAGAEYYVKFTLEGTEYLCSFGHPVSDIDVPYAAVTVPDGEFIEFYGSSIETGANPAELEFIVEVEGFLYVETSGIYTGTYSLEDIYNTVWVWIYSEETWYPYMASSGTVTIDVFNEIGGSVEGSFDATFILSGDLIVPLDLGDEPQEITGTFRVKRVSEEDLPEMIIN